jgi:ribose transport system permease protein
MGLFDLSIAAMATLGGYIATLLLVLYPDTVSVPVAVLASIVICALIGVVNGLIVSYLGISAFIATLATGSIITGSVLGVSDSKTIITGIPDEFMAIGQGSILGVSNPILIMLGVGFVLWLLLEHTQLGRHLYAIGGNAEASRLSGIAVRRYAPFALAVCAACAGLGGLMAAAVLGAGRPQGVGDTYLLNAFAAVFIGASSLRPGKFHILGTLIGVLLIGVINIGDGCTNLLAIYRPGGAARHRVVQRGRPHDASPVSFAGSCVFAIRRSPKRPQVAPWSPCRSKPCRARLSAGLTTTFPPIC